MSPGVPNETALDFFLHEGAVFYIRDRALTSREPHFFVILNHDPKTDQALLLVISSSKVEKTKKRNAHLPDKTLIEIAKNEYVDFTKNSIINCNQVFIKTKPQLIHQINNRGCQKQRMPERAWICCILPSNFISSSVYRRCSDYW